jgi:alkylation response protein AidB-like acyl-CoA dehydrogenase
MDFELTEEQRELRETVREFADRECAPRAAEWDRAGVVTADHEQLEKQLVSLGLYGLALPEAYGGGGQDLLTAVLCAEQLARISPLAAAGIFESNFGPVRVIEQFGSEDQKRRWIPAVCAGETEISIGMSEPDAGSALTDLRTRATLTDSGWAINGLKSWCTGGGHSRAYLVYCRMSDERGAKGIGGVLVEKDTPGFTFGPQESYMGMRGFPSCELKFDDCVVPESNVIVPPGEFAHLMAAFNIERVGNSTMALGIATGALELAVEYAKSRTTFGRPICERSVIQQMVAEMAVRVDAARLLVYRAAANADRGLVEIKEASMAKVFANETAKAVTDMAMEVFGAAGYSTANPIERMLRDSRGWPIAGGTLQIQRLTIASAVFGRRFDQRQAG